MPLPVATLLATIQTGAVEARKRRSSRGRAASLSHSPSLSLSVLTAEDRESPPADEAKPPRSRGSPERIQLPGRFLEKKKRKNEKKKKGIVLVSYPRRGKMKGGRERESAFHPASISVALVQSWPNAAVRGWSEGGKKPHGGLRIPKDVTFPSSFGANPHFWIQGFLLLFPSQECCLQLDKCRLPPQAHCILQKRYRMICVSLTPPRDR
ncbi:hypothetical protein LZ31DRAFT_88871 [Colletotrichum somersetense]|nr:hypothetical protein LZ31DRAFT_88871 [Colletotrichum somersetense]